MSATFSINKDSLSLQRSNSSKIQYKINATKKTNDPLIYQLTYPTTR